MFCICSIIKLSKEYFQNIFYKYIISSSQEFDLLVTLQSVPIIAYVVSSNPANGEVYSIQRYVIKSVSDLRKVGGFLLVHQFLPPIKLTGGI